MQAKGVIVAAGYGTRFLPITRAIPKEMLPLVDRPCIDLVVEELTEAGITDILVITSRRKKALDDWFDHDPELEGVLRRAGRDEALHKVQPTSANVHFVRQRQMGGTGDALRLASDFASDGPVVVAFPDDLFGAPNATAQLLQAHAATGGCVLGAIDMSGSDVSSYGVIDGEPGPNGIRVRRVVEKPAKGSEPSHLISVGRYLYTPDFFPVLADHHTRHTGGEFYPMSAIEELASQGRVSATVLHARRHDTGTPFGYLKAVVDEALARPELAGPFRSWLEQRLDKES